MLVFIFISIKIKKMLVALSCKNCLKGREKDSERERISSYILYIFIIYIDLGYICIYGSYTCRTRSTK